MAQGGIGNQSPATLFQARLDTSDGVSDTLTLRQYSGNKVVVSGVTVAIPDVGLSVDIGDNLIDSAGADAGAPPVASTPYACYISNSRSPFAPSSIRLSATTPTLVNGVKYLGNTGNALNWRFVGWVQPNATPQFESNLAARFIVNYYNRQSARVFVCPNYGGGTYDLTSTVYAPINAGVDDAVQWLSNGEDAAQLLFSAFFVNTIGGVGGRMGIAKNSAAGPVTVAVMTSLEPAAIFVSAVQLEAEGSPSTARMMAVAPSGGTHISFLPSDGPNGAPADVAVTFLEGTVPV